MSAKPLAFRDAAAWRRWLEAHHDREDGAVLVLSKKANPAGLHYLEALDEAVCFGWIDSKGHALDAGHFVLRFSPRKADSVWSVSNRDRVRRLTREGRMTAAGRTTVAVAKASGAWDRAQSATDVPRMPRYLRDALKADPLAWSTFRGWAPTYRGMAVAWVLGAKKEETRTRRIERLVRHAAKDEKPGLTAY